jgi:hypothetical protein
VPNPAPQQRTSDDEDDWEDDASDDDDGDDWEDEGDDDDD